MVSSFIKKKKGEKGQEHRENSRIESGWEG